MSPVWKPLTNSTELIWTGSKPDQRRRSRTVWSFEAPASFSACRSSRVLTGSLAKKWSQPTSAQAMTWNPCPCSVSAIAGFIASRTWSHSG